MQEPENPNKFTKTGKGIEVPFGDLYNYVIEKLAEYDHAIATQQESPTSPYNQPVIYQTQEGKLVQVPVQVQAQAVQVWLDNKTGGGFIGENPEQEPRQQQPQAPQARAQPITQHRHTKVEKSKINIYIIVLVIIIAVVAYWYFFVRTR